MDNWTEKSIKDKNIKFHITNPVLHTGECARFARKGFFRPLVRKSGENADTAGIFTVDRSCGQVLDGTTSERRKRKMIRNGRPYTNENGFIDEALITDRADEVITAVDGWIRKNIRTGKKILHGHTSYGIKHMLEHDTHIYLTNNEFKDAMLLAGYQPVNPKDLNWKYRIELTREINDNPSPFFHWARKFEMDATPCGDFVRDMLHDFEFPILAEHDIIARYLGRIGACSGAVEAFEELWREYAGETD